MNVKLMIEGLNEVSQDRNGEIKDEMQWGPRDIYQNS